MDGRFPGCYYAGWHCYHSGQGNLQTSFALSGPSFSKVKLNKILVILYLPNEFKNHLGVFVICSRTGIAREVFSFFLWIPELQT